MAEPACESVLARESARRLDHWTIEHGTPALELMERAGAEIARALVDHVDAPGNRVGAPPRALVLAGRGNNGGDGFVVARLLAAKGWRVTVALCSGEPRPSGEAAVNLERWRESGGEIITRAAALARLTAPRLHEPPAFDIIVDALYGIGLDRALDADDVALVRALDDSGLAIVAVDIPSGLCADTGRPLGAAVKAALTVTLGSAKAGLFVGAGPDYVGRLVVADIGLAAPADAAIDSLGSLIVRSRVAALAPKRRTTAHKGDGGHVLVCGGSAGKAGAVLLAARAALRAGAGLVTMAVPQSLAPTVDASLWEAMTLALADDERGEVADDAWAAIAPSADGFAAATLGPGLGVGEGAARLLDAFLDKFAGCLVLDADALNVLARGEHSAVKLRTRAESHRGGTILTPHPGEMARLVGTSARSVQADRIASVRACAERFPDVTVVLKGAGTLVASGPALRFNTSGNPGMAAAGMGDVLAGTLAALAAVIAEPLDAASLGVHAHGLAADLLAARMDGPGFFASEVADTLPEALALLRSGKTS